MLCKFINCFPCVRKIGIKIISIIAVQDGVKLSTSGSEFEGSSEAYLEPSQRSKVELFAKIVSG